MGNKIGFISVQGRLYLPQRFFYGSSLEKILLFLCVYLQCSIKLVFMLYKKFLIKGIGNNCLLFPPRIISATQQIKIIWQNYEMRMRGRKESWQHEQYLSNLSGSNKQLILAQKHIKLWLCTKIQYWGQKAVLQTNLKEMIIQNTKPHIFANFYSHSTCNILQSSKRFLFL